MLLVKWRHGEGYPWKGENMANGEKEHDTFRKQEVVCHD